MTIKKSIRLGLLGLAFILPSFLDAFYQFHLFEKEGKRVLVLGWLHDYVMNESNLQGLKALSRIIEEYAQSSTDSSALIFECPTGDELDAGDLSRFPQLKAIIDMQKASSFTYEAYDPRSPASAHSNGVLIGIESALLSFKNKSITFLSSLPLEGHGLRVAEYLHDLEKDKGQLIGWKNEFDPVSDAYKIFSEKLKIYEKSLEEVKALLAGRQEDYFNVAIAELIEQKSRVDVTGNMLLLDAMMKSKDELFTLLWNNLDWLVADAAYLHRVLTDERNLMLLVGLSHANDIEKNLKYLGLSSIVSRSSFTPVGYNWLFKVPSGYGDGLCDAVEMLLKGIDPAKISADSRSSVKLNAVKCAQCGHQPEEPMRCSRCKVAKYCNRECQRMHWREHKNECGVTHD